MLTFVFGQVVVSGIEVKYERTTFILLKAVSLQFVEVTAVNMKTVVSNNAPELREAFELRIDALPTLYQLNVQAIFELAETEEN